MLYINFLICKCIYVMVNRCALSYIALLMRHITCSCWFIMQTCYYNSYLSHSFKFTQQGLFNSKVQGYGILNCIITFDMFLVEYLLRIGLQVWLNCMAKQPRQGALKQQLQLSSFTLGMCEFHISTGCGKKMLSVTCTLKTKQLIVC